MSSKITGEISRQQIDRILKKYARLKRSGRPMVCRPSKEEEEDFLARKMNRGTDGKVIYDSKELAEAANREFVAAGASMQFAYSCERSRHGHHHLTTSHYELEEKLKQFRSGR